MLAIPKEDEPAEREDRDAAVQVIEESEINYILPMDATMGAHMGVEMEDMEQTERLESGAGGGADV